MKRLLSFMLVVVVLCSFSGCDTSPQEEWRADKDTEENNNKTPKLGLDDEPPNISNIVREYKEDDAPVLPLDEDNKEDE